MYSPKDIPKKYNIYLISLHKLRDMVNDAGCSGLPN